VTVILDSNVETADRLTVLLKPLIEVRKTVAFSFSPLRTDPELGLTFTRKSGGSNTNLKSSYACLPSDVGGKATKNRMQSRSERQTCNLPTDRVPTSVLSFCPCIKYFRMIARRDLGWRLLTREQNLGSVSSLKAARQDPGHLQAIFKFY